MLFHFCQLWAIKDTVTWLAYLRFVFPLNFLRPPNFTTSSIWKGMKEHVPLYSICFWLEWTHKSSTSFESTLCGFYLESSTETAEMAHNWQKWKSTFLKCHCHKISGVGWVAAVNLKRSAINNFCDYVKFGAIL